MKDNKEEIIESGDSVKTAISGVIPGSIAEDIGIDKGDLLISVNGNQPLDIIDYRYLISDELVILEIEKPSHEILIFEIEKDEDEDLGITFFQDTFDGVKRCKNKCIFCFIDQMPPSLRDSLYIKDDDYRMSFLYGNFITLTNISNNDLERIKSLRLSPLYISVHSTNDMIRKQMINNSHAASILPLLRKLAEAEIQMHTQIVLCPGINDGRELENSIFQLAELWPQIQSVAVVPVGLTKFKKNTELRTYCTDEAKEIVTMVTKWQNNFNKKISSNFVYLADEFYLMAKIKIPSFDHYEGFPQIENGVGLVRTFYDSFENSLKVTPKFLKNPRQIALVTGKSFGPILKPLVNRLNQIDNLFVELIQLENNFFGKNVTVTGLLTGNDVLSGIKEWQKKCSLIPLEIFIPSVMIKHNEDIFLDGLTVPNLSQKLGFKITVVDSTGDGLVKAIFGN